jgi:3-isopropylmalate dehydrogenase
MSGSYKLAVLPGDGIGSEVVREAMKVLCAVEHAYGVKFDVTEFPCGGKYWLETGKEWPDGTFEFCRDQSDAILLGAVGWPKAVLPNGDIAGAGVIFGLRFGLDLYANVRPCKLYAGVPHKVHDGYRQVWEPSKVDMVILRENTEGCYTPVRGFLRREERTELSVDSRVITRKGAERIIRRAFEIARKRSGAPADGKKRVSCLDKSNVMAGCQLFRQVYDEVAAGYPDVERHYMYIDAFMQSLVREPEVYDVAVTTNMLGDIATDLAAVLQGGMGMAPSGNVGDRHGMFEGVHGSAPPLTGQEKANPIATILAAQMMLAWLGERKSDSRLTDAALGVERAVADLLKDGTVRTFDMGGADRTSDIGTEIARRVRDRA